MFKKRLDIFVLVLLVLSTSVIAENVVSSTPCAGFFGSISCFLWGNPDNWVGQSWFDRGAK